MANPQFIEQAIFAGGCFWCTEAAFDSLKGVKATISGYTGGSETTATYEHVSSGTTEHVEALLVEFDPNLVSYSTLLDTFWDNIDPLDATGQFSDRGQHYRTIIFYNSDEQKEQAMRSLEKIAKQLDANIVTEIRPTQPFYPAEAYHQNFHQKNSLHYQQYKKGSGREQRLNEIKKKRHG